MNTLILGLGNPILSDDSIGIKIACELQDIINDKGVTIIESSSSGLNLLQLLLDYDRAVIIDAIQTKEGKAGYIYHLKPDELKASEHITHCHSASLVDIVQLGKQLGLNLPQQIDIFAIEAADVSTFSEALTPEVADAIPVCLSMIARELGLWLDPSNITVKP
ncbi:MAG: hydrogenase maturation protease [Dehalococcoidales bacterium]|nr:hydrogenase maturation protease [Dehalococcoidales bacterium]